jgi:hypothetical protein
LKAKLETIETVWTGETSLMVHRGGLANPLDLWARKIKKLSSKRKKTDEDYIDLARAEFEGSFYWDEKHGPVMLTNNILSTLINGAKKSKMGREAGLAIFVEGTKETGDAGIVRIDYSGPRTVEELWNNGQGKYVSSELVNVNRARVVRTRPIFPEWSLRFLVKFDPMVLNGDAVVKAQDDAGFYVGLGEWRPRYGRFSVRIL